MSAVGQRYAKALGEMCSPAQATEVLANLTAFGQWMEELPELRTALENPSVPLSAKQAMLAEMASKAGFAEISGRFVALVVAHRRLRQWNDIVAAFRQQNDDLLGLSRAHVVTARPLSPEQREVFAAKLKAALGSEVVLETQEDPALLGGVLLKVGSTVYDGSAAGALTSLRAALEKR